MPTEPDEGADDGVALTAGAEVADDRPDPASITDGPPPRAANYARRPLDRSKFAVAAASLAKQLGEGQSADGDDDGIAIDVAPEVDKAPPAAAGAPAPVETPPQIPAEAIAAWERVQSRAAELDARDADLRDRESKAGDIAARLSADPHALIMELVKRDLGDGASDDDVADEMAYILTQFSLKMTGSEIRPDNIAHQMRMQKRELRRLKLDNTRGKREIETAREREASEAYDRDAAAQIAAEFAPMADKFPWLAKYDDAAALIWDTAKEHERRTRDPKTGRGEVLPLAEIARLCDAHIQRDATPTISRYASLLTPQAPPTPTKPIVPQGDHQRRSSTLSNVGASEDAAPPPRTAAEPTGDDRRRRTFQKYGAAFKEKVPG